MDDKGKAAFHWALAGVFLPGVGPLLSAVLAGNYAFRGGPWSRRLLALAIADLLVFAGLLVLGFRPDATPVALWIPYAIAGGVALAALAASWRRPGPRVWRGFLLAMGLFVLASVLAAPRVPFVAAVLIGHGALLAGGLLAAGALRRDRPPEPPPARSRGRSFLLALYYTVTAYPRAAVLLLAADRLLFDGGGPPADALRNAAATLRDPWGVSLFVFAVVVLGPLAEELVFRGLLLPRLAARIGRGWALAATSVVFGGMHANYGLYFWLTAVLGWTLGWARLSSGGLAAPVALHALFNGAVLAVYFWGSS